MSVFLSPSTPLPPSFQGHRSHRHEQPEATRIIDLASSEEDILKQMKQKGRYNIGVARKHGIIVQQTEDVDAFHRLLKQTGERDQFGIKPLSHYKRLLQSIPGSFLLLAYPSHRNAAEAIAGLLAVIYGKKGIYYYGASAYEHRALMAPYLLQWEAMQYCKAHGCTQYDLLGVAPEGSGDDHAWAGITSFKEKFGGTLIPYPPEQQIILRPLALKALQIKRRILG